MVSVSVEPPRPPRWQSRPVVGKGLVWCVSLGLLGGLVMAAPVGKFGYWIAQLEDRLAGPPGKPIPAATEPSQERPAAKNRFVAPVGDPAALSFDISALDAPRLASEARPARFKPFPPAFTAADGPQRELLCLTQAVYYEAGNQSLAGQQAVAQVVLNRMHHPLFPKSVCGVVYQGSQLRTGCQFTFTCDGSLARSPAPAAWARAEAVARNALSGFVFPGVGSATHYHANYVVPYWAAQLTRLTQIGAHIFYSWRGRGGLPGAVSHLFSGSQAVRPVLSSGIKPTLGLYVGRRS